MLKKIFKFLSSFREVRSLIIFVVDNSSSMNPVKDEIETLINSLITRTPQIHNEDAQLINFGIIHSNSASTTYDYKIAPITSASQYTFKTSPNYDNLIKGIEKAIEIATTWETSANPNSNTTIFVITDVSGESSIGQDGSELIANFINSKKAHRNFGYYTWDDEINIPNISTYIQERFLASNRLKITLNDFFWKDFFPILSKKIGNSKDKSEQNNLKVTIIGFSFISVLGVSITKFDFSTTNIQTDNVQIQSEIENLNIYFKDEASKIVVIHKLPKITQISIETGITPKIKEKQPLNNNSLYFKYQLQDTVSRYSKGTYHPVNNKATEISGKFIRDKINQLSTSFIIKGPIFLTITGETDATPIVDGIPYESEYESILGEIFQTEQDAYKSIYMGWRDSIKTNEELAFMRAFGFSKFLKTEVDLLSLCNTTFRYHTKTNEQDVGGAFRKVSIEMIIHNVSIPKMPQE